MAIRNGSQQGGDYEVEEPNPPPGGGGNLTAMVISIVLVVAGAVLAIYNVLVDAGTAVSWASIALVLIGAAVEGYAVVTDPSKTADTTMEVSLVGQGQTFIAPGDTHQPPQLKPFEHFSRVVFYQPDTRNRLCDPSPLIINPDALVELVQIGETATGGGSSFAIEVTPPGSTV